jgi:protein-disulfide isomerase
MQEQNKEQKNSNLMIPASVVLAAFIIGAGIYFSNRENSSSTANNLTSSTQITGVNINPVSNTDHILGNPDAQIVVVEFSDTECPYCKVFQNTMQTVINTYGKDGKVAWVYRHFPVHSLTLKEAEATECANELGGNNIFWKYIDEVFSITDSTNTLDPSKLTTVAKDVGLDTTKFNTCLANEKYANLIAADQQDGIKAGAQGTPYSVLVLKSAISDDKANTISNYIAQNGLSQNVTISQDKKELTMNGALPVDMVKVILDDILK